MSPNSIEKLRLWFQSQARDLPWRENPTPYAVWVSEIMLQQTQASVVTPYFIRWMQRFPTIESLAQAPIEHVLKEWEGLGYYSRARFLHEGAQYVVAQCGGVLPHTAEELQKIKGLGSYTVGAILSFAFHQRKAAVDGNVLRVMSRLLAIDEDISKQKTVKKIADLTESLLPNHEPWVISEALIELGATVCSKVPKCQMCPLKEDCIAYKKGMTDKLPVRAQRAASTKLFRTVLVVEYQGAFMVSKGKKGKIMADLYEFPYVESEISKDQVETLLLKEFTVDGKWIQELPSVSHSFTRFQAYLTPHHIQASSIKDLPNYEWLTIPELDQKAFSSGHRRIYANIKDIKA